MKSRHGEAHADCELPLRQTPQILRLPGGLAQEAQRQLDVVLAGVVRRFGGAEARALRLLIFFAKRHHSLLSGDKQMS